MGTSAERRRWTVVLFAFVTLSGLALQVRGPLLSSFQGAFGVTESQLGLIPPAAAVGYLLSLVSVGMSLGRIDPRRYLALGVAGTAVGAILTGLAPTFVLLVAFIVGRTMATGAVRGLDRPVLSHLYPGRRGRIFNLHSTAWAIGAAAGPLLVNATLALGNWRLTYLVAGALFLPLALAIRRLEPPAGLENERPPDLGDLRAILDRPTVRGMAVALVLIVGVESSLFTWLPFYAAGIVGRSRANLLLSVYLVAYVPGRLAFSYAVERVPRLGLVFASALGAVGLLGVALATEPTTPVLFASAFGAGFLIAGLFPTLVSWGTDAAPEHSGPINAIAMTAGQAGFFTAPAIVGVLAERFGIAAGMRVPLALLAVMVPLVGWLAVRGR